MELFKNKKKEVDNNIIKVFRQEQKKLEGLIYKAHDDVMKNIALPTAKDLAALNKPEADCDSEQAYCGILSGAYGKLMMIPRTELQTQIETLHIEKEKEESEQKIEVLQEQHDEKKNKLRIKTREVEDLDNRILKKESRAKRTDWLLGGMILIDMLLSSTALQALNYSLVSSYIIGLGIGLGIFFISKYIPTIIRKGRTILQQRIIAASLFVGLCTIFYVLGIFRSATLDTSSVVSQSNWPFYFMCLNMFFVLVATAANAFTALTVQERQQLDNWRIAKEEKEVLEKEVHELQEKIQQLRKEQHHNELARRQLLMYAEDIQLLIQQLYEEAYKTFMSANLIHRTDAQVPAFFTHPIPKLPLFYRELPIATP